MPKDKDIKFGCGEYFTIHWKTRTCGHDNELCPSCTKAFQQVRKLIEKMQSKVGTGDCGIYPTWQDEGNTFVKDIFIELLEHLPKGETK